MNYAIVGFGAAGFQALKAIRECGSEDRIDVYSDHRHPPYNSMLTTYYLKGKIPFQAMFPFGSLEEIRQTYQCRVYTETRIEALDAPRKTLRLQNGETRTYDRILLATGASPVHLPVGDIPQDRIYVMRTVDDALRLKKTLDTGRIRRILVVGASWVGIKLVEVAWTLGIQTVLSDLADHIFITSAFEKASEKCEDYLRSENVELHFGAKTEDCELRDGQCHIRFSDHTETDVDLVVMCVGIRPQCRWLDPGQLTMGRGIVVDKHMETSVHGIYAAGDCCEANDLMLGAPRNIGLWANARAQGYTAGCNMAGCPTELEGNILHNITHFMDMDFISFGDKTLPGERKVLLDDGRRYMEILTLDGHLQCINILENYELSGVIKNCIMKYFSKGKEPLNELEIGILARSGLPNELLRILGGMIQ